MVTYLCLNPSSPLHNSVSYAYMGMTVKLLGWFFILYFGPPTTLEKSVNGD